MDTGFLHTHVLIVSLYLLQLLVKVVLLGMGKQKNNYDSLEKFSTKSKIPHIVLASLLVVTGGYLYVKLLMNGDARATAPYMLIKLALVFGSIPIGIIAMKKKNLILGILSFLMLAYTFMMAKKDDPLLRSAEARTEQALEDLQQTGDQGDADLTKGKAIYTTRCQLCHGADGKMGFQGAKDLTQTEMTDEQITQIIRNGKGVMPPVSEREVSDDDVAKVVKYVRSLKN